MMTVHGRPVRYSRSRWGGQVEAVERGYFPVSETGYHSLAQFLAPGEDADDPLIEDLEILAKAKDARTNQRVTEMRAIARARTPDLLVAFTLFEAVNGAMFARANVRDELFALTYAVSTWYLKTPETQPAPGRLGEAWTAEACAEHVQRVELLREWLTLLIAGNFLPPPMAIAPFLHAARAYFELPNGSTPDLPAHSQPADDPAQLALF